MKKIDINNPLDSRTIFFFFLIYTSQGNGDEEI